MQAVTQEGMFMNAREGQRGQGEFEWYEPGRPGGLLRGYFGSAGRKETWLAIVHSIFVAFILGHIWFVLIVVGIASGAGLAITLIGLPILALTLFGWGWMASVERVLSNALLGTSIPPLRYREPRGPGIVEAIKARLRTPLTWRSLILLLFRMAQGTVSFVLTIVALSLPLGLMALPATFWIGDGPQIGPGWQIDHLFEALPFGLLGFVLLFAGLHAAYGIGRVSAWLNTALLGPDAPEGPRPAPVAPPAGSPSAAAAAPPPQPEAPAAAQSSIVGQVRETGRQVGAQAKSAWSDFEQRANAAIEAFQRGSAAEAPQFETEASAETQTTSAERIASLEEEKRPGHDDQPPVDGGDDMATGSAEAPELEVDVVARIVRVDGEEVPLTRREFDLLALFAANPERAFSREELLDRIWKNEYDVTDRTIDTHVLRLRKKLGPAAEAIQTVWGVGYRFSPE